LYYQYQQQAAIATFSLSWYYTDMETLIQPRILKGFRDFLPAAEIERAGLTEKITRVYRSFGFVPIDTPVLEYTEILLRKSDGETEKQVFRFQDNGGRDVALRFDLTVPFARFTAEHESELYFPFKRYHIAKVWRGEKPQAGRYREFVQCDIDTVGSDSAAADFEILNVMRTALAEIGVTNITIRVNHRGIFNRFLAACGQSEKSEDILRIVDKIAKVGRDEVTRELTETTGSAETAAHILTYISGADDYDQTLALLEKMAGGPDRDTARMRDLREMMKAAGIEATYVFDPSITRGLDYYTGIVYETFLNDLPSIGSVCSGGRYDNLAGLYMKGKVPGVGASIGLDRLIAGLEELGKTENKGSYLDAEIFCMDESLAIHYQRTAAQLRAAGIAVEVFPDAKKLAAQYAVTDAKKIPWGILIDGQDVPSGKLTLKKLATREQFTGLTPEAAAQKIIAEKSR
jgi:histidyl-tRNA synthetase